MQTNCNEVIVLQQDEHSSVINSRPAGEEVTEILEKMKRRKREVKVQFKRELLIIFHVGD